MDPQAELRIIRAAYAKQILAAASVDNPRLVSAFAAIPREDFLGPGPWLMWRWSRYVATPEADPVYLYTNDLVALASISRDVQELIQQVFKDKILPSEMAKRQAAASDNGAAAT